MICMKLCFCVFRAQILKKSSEYISYMKKKNAAHARDVEDLKGQNKHIEQQIKALEKAKTTGTKSSRFDIFPDFNLRFSSRSIHFSFGGPGTSGIKLRSDYRQ